MQVPCFSFNLPTESVKNVYLNLKAMKCVKLEDILVKYKVQSITCHEGTEKCSYTLSLTLALNGGGWFTPSLARFFPGNDQEAGRAPGQVWAGAINLAPHRDSIP